MKREKPEVGFVPIAMDLFWDQYPDLKKRALEKMAVISERLKGFCEVLSFGLVGNKEEADKALGYFKKSEPDALIIWEDGYVSSDIPKVIIDGLKDTVIILLITQKDKTLPGDMDYERYMENTSLTGQMELGGALSKSNINYFSIVENIEGTLGFENLERLVRAASINKDLKKLNIGVIGHPFPGMLDVAVDERFVSEIGPKITRIALSDLEGEIRSIKSGDVDYLIAEVKKEVKTEYVSHDDLYKAVRLFIAYEHLSRKFKVNSYTILCQDYINVAADAPSCLALSLLQNRFGFSTGCEGDIPNTIGAYILKKLTGLSPMFVDWTMYDEKENALFFQHCGVADPAIVSCPILKQHTERFGYSGEGVAFEVMGKPGEVTMLSLIHDGADWKMFGSEGEAIDKKPFTCGLNQMFVKIDSEVKEYLENVCNIGLTHHLNIGYGHVLEELKNLAKIIKVNFLSL